MNQSTRLVGINTNKIVLFCQMPQFSFSVIRWKCFVFCLPAEQQNAPSENKAMTERNYCVQKYNFTVQKSAWTKQKQKRTTGPISLHRHVALFFCFFERQETVKCKNILLIHAMFKLSSLQRLNKTQAFPL